MKSTGLEGLGGGECFGRWILGFRAFGVCVCDLGS